MSTICIQAVEVLRTCDDTSHLPLVHTVYVRRRTQRGFCAQVSLAPSLPVRIERKTRLGMSPHSAMRMRYTYQQQIAVRQNIDAGEPTRTCRCLHRQPTSRCVSPNLAQFLSSFIFARISTKNLRYQLIVIGERVIDASSDIGQVGTTLDGKILGAITCNSSRPIAPGLKRRASLEQRRVANLWQQTTIRTRAPLTTSLIQRRCIMRVHREDTIPLRPTTLTPRHIARASFTE